jgi:hypothetical protein
LVLVEGAGELGDGGGHLDAGEEDAFLSLEGDVFGPLDEAGEVALGLDGVAHSEVAGTFLEEGVHSLLHLLCSLFSLNAFSLP